MKNEELSETSIGTKFKLTGLLPGSTYKLQIIAEAKETTGHPKIEKFDTFLETPLNIRTIKYHTTSAKICWDAVFMADGYTVHYGSLRPEDRTARLKDRVQNIINFIKNYLTSALSEEIRKLQKFLFISFSTKFIL